MRLFFTALILSLSLLAKSQTAELKGKVISEEKNEAVSFATVTLKTSSESAPLAARTNDNGEFSIKNIPYGTYIISVSSIGFQTYTANNITVNQASKTLNTILLKSSSKQTKNVVIKGEKSTMEIRADKKVFNVDKNITAAGGTAEDILKNVPSVQVDINGGVSLRGKEGVTLLVDGKPSAMFGDDVQTALQTIPASSIESVEVITNPSSKYDAQGTGGIINIILKKDRKAGYNGLFNIGVSAPFRFNTGFNVNANVKKWNVFANANFRTSNQWEKSETRRDNYDNALTFSSNTHNDRRPQNVFASLGFDYTFNKNNKVTFSQSLFHANMKGDSRNTILNEINYEDQISRQSRRNVYTGQPLGLTSNLQYKKNFKDPKEELNVELNYSDRTYRRESTFETFVYNDKDSLINDFTQSNPVRGGNRTTTIQVDYSKPIGKNSKIELGERTYLHSFRSENQPIINIQRQGDVPEPLLKNKYRFTQQVHGLYTNLSTQYKNLSLQGGLRAEYFAYEGFVYQFNRGVSNGYLSLFPTFFASYKLNDKEDLNFNYARRINRPNFFQLVPFIDVSNPQDTSVGNPDLNPEFINAIELTYVKQYAKNATFMASTYYQYTTNIIQRYRRFNENGTTFSQNQNLATGQTYGVELTNKMNLLPWWDASLNINVFRNIINGTNVNSTLSRSGFGGFGKLIMNAKLKHSFSTQLTANYNARTVIAQGEIEPYGNVDFALKRSFFKNLATLTFNINDLFNTIETNTFYTLYPYYNQQVYRKNQTRTFGLNLQIRFANKAQTASANTQAPPRKSKKDEKKEGKNRDENLKKDEGGGGEENNPGSNRDK